MQRNKECCLRCDSTEFGIESWEAELEFTFSVYCKNCLQEFYQWAYPKPEAFEKGKQR